MFPCPRLPWNWSVFKCIAWRCGWCWWAGGSCTGKTQASQSSVQPQNLPGLLTVTTLGIWTVEDGRRANVELKHMLSRFFAKMTPMTVNLVNLPLKDKYKSLTWDETCWKLQRCQHVPDRHITFVSRSSLSRWQLCLISIFMVTCFSTSNFKCVKLDFKTTFGFYILDLETSACSRLCVIMCSNTVWVMIYQSPYFSNKIQNSTRTPMNRMELLFPFIWKYQFSDLDPSFKKLK